MPKQLWCLEVKVVVSRIRVEEIWRHLALTCHDPSHQSGQVRWLELRDEIVEWLENETIYGHGVNHSWHWIHWGVQTKSKQLRFMSRLIWRNRLAAQGDIIEKSGILPCHDWNESADSYDIFSPAESNVNKSIRQWRASVDQAIGHHESDNGWHGKVDHADDDERQHDPQRYGLLRIFNFLACLEKNDS